MTDLTYADDGTMLSTTVQDFLEEIDSANRDVITAEEQLYGIVGQARAAKVPWALIGRVFGVSAQAVQQRFSKPPRGRLF